MSFTEESIKLQKFLKSFDKFTTENLTKTHKLVIKSFFEKMNYYHYNKPPCLNGLNTKHDYKIKYSNLFNAIPEKIQNDIKSNYTTIYKTTYKIHSKTVNYNIYIKPNQITTKEIDDMIYKMNLWLSIAVEIANNACSGTLDIHFFFTEHKKITPEYNKPIDRIHANTAFTTSCSPENEIYIYRKEEWFKVFIHECFHCLGLDFSHMNVENSNKYINNLFSTKINDIRLYESYCETWAETLNLVFIAFIRTVTKINYEEMFKTFQNMFNEELTFSIYQMTTILKKQNMQYSDLLIKDNNNVYTENTNAFSYYIIKSINMFNMNEFISWCSKNNRNVIDFKKSNNNIMEYCRFIKKHYKNPNFIRAIEYIENRPNNPVDTLRMTAFEIL